MPKTLFEKLKSQHKRDENKQPKDLEALEALVNSPSSKSKKKPSPIKSYFPATTPSSKVSVSKSSAKFSDTYTKEGKQEAFEEDNQAPDNNIGSSHTKSVSKKRKVSIDEINIDDVEIEPYYPTSTQRSSIFKRSDTGTQTAQKSASNNKKSKSECTKLRRKEIGNWGEALVYKKLRQQDPQAETIWHNDVSTIGEQGLPYDISQKKANENKKYHEVKTTVALSLVSENTASFSKRQIKKMQEEGSNYNVCRVYNAETKKAKITTINDPYQKIFHPIRKGYDESKPFKPKFPIVGFKLKI